MVRIYRFQWIFTLFTFVGFFLSYTVQAVAQDSGLIEAPDPEWIEPQAQEWLAEDDYLYRGYFDFTGMAGGQREVGQGLLFVPLSQDEESLFFADLRGNIFDDSTFEGNFGLAFRRMIDDQWIAGIYGFYDVSRSQNDNIFRQGSFGVELLSIEWDFRVNGYVPNQKPKRVNSMGRAFISGNNIVVQGMEERAYWGTDFEMGRLLKTFPESNVDAEIRGYVGGYYFDNSTAGFQKMAGPRARVELRTFDLPLLGNGSRVVLGAQYQYDELRGSQTQAMLTVRVPLPGNGDAQRLSRFQRRMVNPIVRDLDIVASQGDGPVEQAKLQQTGQVLNNITVIDANTAAAETVFANAGADSVVVFDGSAGTIDSASGFVFNNGQLALGGGVQVVGCNSGAVATFGSRPTVNGTVDTNDVFTLANNATLTGINATGGKNSVFGNGTSGFTIASNSFSGAKDNGVRLSGAVTDGTISNNTATGNGGDGFGFSGTVSGGTISGNTATGNGEAGFNFSYITGGTISGNTATGNYSDGFSFYNISGGTISNNTATGNDDDGFSFYLIEGGTINNNTATGNDDDGFFFNSYITGGTISGNTATENDDNGFHFTYIDGGTISGNTATGNNGTGFFFQYTLSGGTLSNNTATGNDRDGFNFSETVSGGTISGNTATENDGHGFNFSDTVSGGTISGNTATGNNGTGFLFDTFSGGTFSNNTAIGNEYGFLFDGTFTDGTASSNTATGNDTGFFISGFSGGNTATFETNTATNNTNEGYRVLSGTPSVGKDTNTGSGNGSNDDF
tara:strand:+ start:1100 stop:3469 length:2370 start_codon:yes stop_codon:yes gene_type:complete